VVVGCLHKRTKMRTHLLGKVFEAKPVCSVLKEYDGSPMDVLDQKDVQEFSDMLFTRLENEGAKVFLFALHHIVTHTHTHHKKN